MESRLAEAGILADKKMVTKEFCRQNMESWPEPCSISALDRTQLGLTP